MINSGFLNGTDNKKESIAKMLDFLEEKVSAKRASSTR